MCQDKDLIFMEENKELMEMIAQLIVNPSENPGLFPLSVSLFDLICTSKHFCRFSSLFFSSLPFFSFPLPSYHSSYHFGFFYC
jgi:hypothetical protein